MPPKPPRVALAAAMFHQDIAAAMLTAAAEALRTAGATHVATMQVPGCYELPLLADALLRRDDVDVVVTLGFIEQGETLHGEVMGHVVHAALVNLSLQYQKPVGIGIIGPGATVAQAETRQRDYAAAAVRAALAALHVQRNR